MLAAGIARWASMDASPQGGIEWVLAGATTMLTSKLHEAFDLSLSLCRPSVSADMERIAVCTLTPLLLLQQGVPTAVGSGRASLQHKMHALVHAERLRQKSWGDTITAINATLTFTGDLGSKPGSSTSRCRYAT